MDSMNGSIGGFMVKKMIEAQERAMRGESPLTNFQKDVDKTNGVCYNNDSKATTTTTNKREDSTMKNLTSKVNGMGTIQIPAEICRELGIKTNDVLAFKTTNGGNIKIKKVGTALSREQIIQNVLRSMPTRTTFFGEDKDERLTVCIITSEHDGFVTTRTGVAKCQINDEWNQEQGMAIALLRAMGREVPAELTE